MPRLPAVTVAALLTGLALVGCSTGSTTDNPAPTAAPGPGRPTVVLMNGIDPCAVLTDDEVRGLGIEKARKHLTEASADNGNAPQCVWNVTGFGPSAGIYVQGVTYRSVDDVLSDTSAPTTVIDVQGFRAVERDNSLSEKNRSCQVFVDVADGQAFQVAYQTGDTGGLSQTCQRAEQAAEFGMTYLLHR
jgi:hypothetical protein